MLKGRPEEYAWVYDRLEKAVFNEWFEMTLQDHDRAKKLRRVIHSAVRNKRLMFRVSMKLDGSVLQIRKNR